MVIEYGNRPTGNTKIKVTFVYTYVIIFKATPPFFCIHYNKSLSDIIWTCLKTTNMLNNSLNRSIKDF